MVVMVMVVVTMVMMVMVVMMVVMMMMMMVMVVMELRMTINFGPRTIVARKKRVPHGVCVDNTRPRDGQEQLLLHSFGSRARTCMPGMTLSRNFSIFRNETSSYPGFSPVIWPTLTRTTKKAQSK